MADKATVEQIVEQVVGNVLEAHVPQLRADLVSRVLQELKPQLSEESPPAVSNGNTAELVKSVASIHAGSTQKEILRALLDSTAPYCGRSALFVIKGGNATGWQGRGFSNADDIKDFGLSLHGAAGQALQTRTDAALNRIARLPAFARFSTTTPSSLLIRLLYRSS